MTPAPASAWPSRRYRFADGAGRHKLTANRRDPAREALLGGQAAARGRRASRSSTTRSCARWSPTCSGARRHGRDRADDRRQRPAAACPTGSGPGLTVIEDDLEQGQSAAAALGVASAPRGGLRAGAAACPATAPRCPPAELQELLRGADRAGPGGGDRPRPPRDRDQRPAAGAPGRDRAQLRPGQLRAPPLAGPGRAGPSCAWSGRPRCCSTSTPTSTCRRCVAACADSAGGAPRTRALLAEAQSTPARRPAPPPRRRRAGPSHRCPNLRAHPLTALPRGAPGRRPRVPDRCRRATGFAARRGGRRDRPQGRLEGRGRGRRARGRVAERSRARARRRRRQGPAGGAGDPRRVRRAAAGRTRRADLPHPPRLRVRERRRGHLQRRRTGDTRRAAAPRPRRLRPLAPRAPARAHRARGSGS